MAGKISKSGIVVLIGIGIALVLGLGIATLYALDGKKITPVVLLVLAAGASLVLPMIRANFFPSARDCAAEYEFHEKRLAAQHRQWISETYGPDAYDGLFAAPDRFRENADEKIEALRQDPRAGGRGNTDLALIMTLARFYETRGDAGKSTAILSQALTMEPFHFIANFRMAMLCEWVDEPGRAVRHYRQAAKDPQGLSRAMRKLVAAQVARLAKETSQGS